MKEIDQLKSQFLSDDIDEEERLENERKIREWETTLFENIARSDWQNHDVTRLILQQAKTAYKEFGVLLSENRFLTEQQRLSYWAKQDACVFLIALIEKDSDAELERVRLEIKRALNAT